MSQTGTTTQSPIRWKLVVLRLVLGVERHPWYGLLVAVGLVAVLALVHPESAMLLAAMLVLVVAPFLWLFRHHQAYAFVGALLFLTILRPLPSFIDSDGIAVPSGLYDRLLDLVWILFVVAALAYWILGRHKRLRVWPASYWLLAGTLAVMLSIAGAGLWGRGIVLRDLFELYRGPYYFLILLLAAQVAWDDEKLSRFLYKPFLAALLVVSAVTVIQGLDDWGASFVSAVYTPRFTESFFETFTNPIGSGSGSFFLINAGTFANSNWFGVALGLMMPFLMAGLFLRSSRSLRAVVWVATIATFAMILVAGSRAGLAMGTFSVFAYFLLWVWDIWRRPLVTDHSSRNIWKLAPFLLLMLSIALLVGIAAIRGDRYHGTVVGLGGAVFQEISSAIQWNKPSIHSAVLDDLERVAAELQKATEVLADARATEVPADARAEARDRLNRLIEDLRSDPTVDIVDGLERFLKDMEGDSNIPGTVIIELKRIVEFMELTGSLEDVEEGGFSTALSNIMVGRYTNQSGSRKFSGSVALIKQTWEKSPVIGFGPFKVGPGRDYATIDPERAGAKANVLGDTQYSVLFFRYGIVGTAVWFGFWIAVMWYAFRSWLRSTTPVQIGLARAVLAAVPVFLLVSVAGAFFDSRQLTTVFLLLISVAVSSRGKPDEETT